MRVDLTIRTRDITAAAKDYIIRGWGSENAAGVYRYAAAEFLIEIRQAVYGLFHNPRG
jgi:hypothetical protein